MHANAALSLTQNRQSPGKSCIHKFFVTDDNFARDKDWEAILIA